MNEVDVKAYLIENDHEFRQLAQQHQDYELQLQLFQNKPYLNEQEQFEATVIKKKKLALKDQMQLRIHRYRSERAVQ